MQNAVLIALVLVIVIFAAYQYKPSLFRFGRRADGFENMADANMAAMENAHGSNNSAHGSFPGNAQHDLTMSNSHINPVPSGNPQSMEAFEDQLKKQPAAQPPAEKKKEGFADLSSYEGPANFGAAEAPAGCYPRDQLTPAELLPKDMNSIWAEQNPMGPGSLKGKNFLSAGALIGVNTVGQSLRNANLQIRSEPPNPQVPVSIFMQSTIGPDISHRTLEIN
jgi:hypothetical protein